MMMSSSTSPRSPQSKSSGKSRGRSNSKAKKTTKYYPCSLTLIAVTVFGLIWVTALWFSHASLSAMEQVVVVPSLQQQQQQQGSGGRFASGGTSRINDLNAAQNNSNNNNHRHHHQQQQQVAAKRNFDRIKNNIINHDDESNNPYFGWQPRIPEKMACSWRDCFHKTVTCSTCRDRREDIDPLDDEESSSFDDKDWIPDVTMLHRMRLQGHDRNGNPWPPSLRNEKELCEPIGSVGGKLDTNKELIDAVPIVAQPPDDNDDDAPKILCMLYTIESAHATTIRAIRETWASHCDGFLAFSNYSDPRIPAYRLVHEGPEDYYNMWQKVRSIWKFVGTHYLDQFDWFFQGGDDLFVLPQNLRNYLRTLDDPQHQDHFVGRRFKGYGNNNYFNSGGSGYALSRATLRKYVTQGWNDPACIPTRKTAMEDVMIAQCFRTLFNISLTDTRDDQGRERFHPFAPGTHYHWQPPQLGSKDWYADYNTEWPPKLGKDCCAPDSVSFHYIKKPAMVRHMFALLYECGK